MTIRNWVAFRTDNPGNVKHADWVANLPGKGGKDWGYTSDRKQRLLLTETQAKRFQSHMRKLGKEQHVVLIRLNTVASWRPEMFVDGQYSANGQRFATEEEALESASDLYSRWTQPSGYRAMPSSESVNYKRQDGRDVAVTIAWRDQ